jgi:DNA-binding SARP family transcriptional activator
MGRDVGSPSHPLADAPVNAQSSTGRRPETGAGYVLQLLGGFQLTRVGEVVHLPRAEQRVLACLALSDRRQPRSRLAGRLWPDAAESRAMARLRTSMWRLRQPGRRLLDCSNDTVGLDPLVAVDVHELTTLVHRSLDPPLDADGERLEALAAAGELLPEWDDEWLIPQRERLRQIRLHALEDLGEHLADEGHFARAVEVGLAVVADDPMRESAQRVLIRIFAAEGNVHEALVRYRAYRDVMRDELGLDPSPQMEALIDELGIGPARAGRA